jgi:hypothetical protein
MTSPIGLESSRHFRILTLSAADLPICVLETRGFFSKHMFTVFRVRPQYKSWKSGERDDPRNKSGLGFSICRSNIDFYVEKSESRWLGNCPIRNMREIIGRLRRGPADEILMFTSCASFLAISNRVIGDAGPCKAYGVHHISNLLADKAFRLSLPIM